MFQSLFSRMNLMSICRLLFVMAVTCVPGTRDVMAASIPPDEGDEPTNIYYTTSFSAATPELWAIKMTGRNISTTDVGPMNAGGCASLAMSPSGTLFSMCGNLFGVQQLATIDTKTGQGTLFGMPVPGLAIMAMAFAPNGTLYAVGDCNPNGANFECGPGAVPDPNYNSLYTVNQITGAVTRVGSTGAPQFFMDLTFDREGNMFGVTSTLNPSYVPAILYRINPETGAATKIVNLVGSNSVMGLALSPDGKMYATDFTGNSGLYRIDPKTGFETAIAAMPFGLSSGLELENPIP